MNYLSTSANNGLLLVLRMNFCFHVIISFATADYVGIEQKYIFRRERRKNLRIREIVFYTFILRFCGYLFILLKNSAFDFVFASFSVKSSIASTLFNSFKTLRKIQILFNSSGLSSNSSCRVLERLISMAGYILL